MFKWLFKKIFTEENISEALEIARPQIRQLIEEEASSMAKTTIHDILSDEEIGAHVAAYTDNIYNRYLGKGGKFWGSIGGMTKGINYEIGEQMDSMNPLSGILDNEGNLNFSGIVKSIIANAFRGQATETPQYANPGQTRAVFNKR